MSVGDDHQRAKILCTREHIRQLIVLGGCFAAARESLNLLSILIYWSSANALVIQSFLVAASPLSIRHNLELELRML